MYRRIAISLVLLLIVVSAIYAQGEDYTWEPHDFTVTLPEGWVAIEDSGHLILGMAEDAERLKNGMPLSDMVVLVQVVQQLPQTPNDTDWTPMGFLDVGRDDFLDLEVEERSYGTSSYPTVDTPVHGSLRGRLVFVADSFMLTATAPSEMWEDALPALDNLIASIAASPVQIIRPPELTAQITWHGLSFRVPEDWQYSNIGNYYGIVATTFADNRYFGATFRYNNLMIGIRDLSFARPMLGPESLSDLSMRFFSTGDVLTGFREETYNDFIGYVADFADEAGSVVLLMSPYNAYLVVGVAGEHQWRISEQRLFENMLETMMLADFGTDDSDKEGIIPTSGEWSATIIESEDCEPQSINWVIRPQESNLEIEAEEEVVVLFRTEPDYYYAFDAGVSLTLHVLSSDTIEGIIFDGVDLVCDIEVVLIDAMD